MTEPREPGEIDPVDAVPPAPRRGRHAAPDDDDDEVTTPPLPASAVPAFVDDSPGRHAAPTESDAGAPPLEQLQRDEPQREDAQRADAPVNDTQIDDAQRAEAPASNTQADDAQRAGAPVNDTQIDDAQRADAPASDTQAEDALAAPRRGRHASDDSSFRPQGWMIGVAAVVVAGLLAWLIIGLTSGGDDTPAAASSSAPASTSSAPQPVDAASLPQVLCMGSSYITVDTGQPAEALLADPKGIEAKFPGSKLSTIPPGCIAGSEVRDQVVLALGPYPSIEEACAAGKALQGVQYTAYAGSAATGLTQTTCP